MLKRLLKFRNKKPEISIIIPVYNDQKYLKECLDSAINQTFEDIEIICVDDGSTDESLKILNDYAKKDNRVKVISQENKGSGGARNTGFGAARGKYIYFMDGDDYVELNALNELHDLIEENSCDLVLFKTRNFKEDTGEYIYEPYYEMKALCDLVGNKVFKTQDYLKELIFMDVTVYTKFFKRKIASNIRFIEGMIFEDNLYAMELALNAKSTYFHNEYLYHRRLRENSVMTKDTKRFMDSLDILCKMEDLFKQKGHYEDVKEALFIRKYSALNNRLSLIDPEYKEEFFQRIKSDLTAKHEGYAESIDFNGINEKVNKIYNKFRNSKNYEEFKKID